MISVKNRRSTDESQLFLGWLVLGFLMQIQKQLCHVVIIVYCNRTTATSVYSVWHLLCVCLFWKRNTSSAPHPKVSPLEVEKWLDLRTCSDWLKQTHLTCWLGNQWAITLSLLMLDLTVTRTIVLRELEFSTDLALEHFQTHAAEPEILYFFIPHVLLTCQNHN